jgi:serine/threonine protein kinase
MAKQTEGLLVGRYKLLRELARGGFGITYLAKDAQSSNTDCVVKKLNPQNADIETAKILFQREAHILYYLQQNRQIPKYFNYFEDGQDFYLVQEYIQGKSLDQLLDKLWTKTEVIDFLREILLILKYLHQINIIHRDIKPSNVIRRDKDKKFVLIDFGSVKQLDPRYLSSKFSHQQPPPLHTMIGTPGYAPVEQMEGRPSFNSDIYGLGITAIQLLTGIRPRNLERDAEDNVIFPGGVDIDAPLAHILTTMVYTSPERRYQFVDDVLDSLNTILGHYNNGSTGNENATVRNLDDIAETKVDPTPLFGSPNPIQVSPKIVLRLWHIPILVTVIGIIVVGLELINPFIRPFYYSYEGNRLLDLRQPEAALEQFENLKELKPNSVEAWKGRGDALLSLGSDNRALDSYNKALSLQSNNLKALNNKGKVLYKMGQYQDALETHEKVVAIDSNNAEAWSGKGLAYMGLGKYEEASKSFDKLRQIRPDEPRIWYEIGLATELLQGPQAARKHYEEALWSYDFFLKRKPQNLIAWTDRGTVLLKLGRLEDALKSYQKALEIDRNFYEALLGTGNSYFAMGIKKREEALLAFNQASKVRPEDYQVWHNRGIVLTQYFKDHEGALQSFEKVVELRNNFYPAWQSKGLALLELKRYEAALNAFDKAKSIEPKDPYIWANRGSVLDLLGRTQEARDSYNKAIELGFPPEQLREQLEKN